MPTLMIQGTTSDAGKSTMVTALCRLLRRRGASVAPFKPQNMALNSAVSVDGGEIGRAQAVQARAAGVEPHTDHNPILLKPTTDRAAQVVVHGRPLGVLGALDYHAYKAVAKQAVLDSYRRLAARYEWVIVEGAGSPAEVNLRENDIANMGFAEAVDCPVWLVGDIDRGGIFAHFVGTLDCLSESERSRTRGFVVNRFRGDASILEPGLRWLEARTGKPVLAVVPYLHGFDISAEDALPREPGTGRGYRIAVPALPRISNHTDFDPLRRLPDVELRFVGPGEMPPAADLVILPGTKNTRADLAWLRQQGWEAAIARHLRYGGKLIGICGGMQMLGKAIHDPMELEGEAGSSPGLGWLDLETTLAGEKQLGNVEGRLEPSGAPIAGYEIHHGITTGAALSRPSARLGREARADGALSADGQVMGTYVHGIFDRREACSALLRWAGHAAIAATAADDVLDEAIDRAADALESALDRDKAAAAGFPLGAA